MTDSQTLGKLNKTAWQLRYDIVEMIGIGNAGHLGGSSSLAELIAVLYFNNMKINKDNPNDPLRDRLILSKGHAALIQYAALCELGFFPRTELKRVKSLGGLLQGHPDMSIPGIEAVTGSLGQGLSIAVGMALAMRLDRKNSRIYVVMGDGEQSEGQIWEAAMAACRFKLDNLTAFIDCNKLQASGTTKEIFEIPNIDKKWQSFGWKVISKVNGHDISQIIDAIEEAIQVKGRPCVILLDTIKGKGFSFAENNPAYHNSTLDETTYYQALRELEMQKMGSK
jgi:transketolase